MVEQILREHNFKGWEFEFNLEKTYPKREQINQINESDRQFIERLLSEVGIFIVLVYKMKPKPRYFILPIVNAAMCMTKRCH